MYILYTQTLHRREEKYMKPLKKAIRTRRFCTCSDLHIWTKSCSEEPNRHKWNCSNICTRHWDINALGVFSRVWHGNTRQPRFQENPEGSKAEVRQSDRGQGDLPTLTTWCGNIHMENMYTEAWQHTLYVLCKQLHINKHAQCVASHQSTCQGFFLFWEIWIEVCLFTDKYHNQLIMDLLLNDYSEKRQSRAWNVLFLFFIFLKSIKCFFQ